VADLKAKWDSLQAAQSNLSGNDTRALQNRANDYLAIHQARTLYAPQLALLKDVIPDSIQLAQARFSLVSETPPARPAPEAEGAPAAKAGRAAAPKTIERLDLILEGSIACARPEIEIDSFIKGLRAHPQFGPLLKDAQLRSMARVGGAATPGTLPSANFVIACLYKESK
jgi:hypothetical protein